MFQKNLLFWNVISSPSIKFHHPTIYLGALLEAHIKIMQINIKFTWVPFLSQKWYFLASILIPQIQTIWQMWLQVLHDME
jgi:hypothetical protein